MGYARVATFHGVPDVPHFGFLDGQVHAVKGACVRLSECLAALTALIAGESVAVFAELPAFGSAVVAGHFG